MKSTLFVAISMGSLAATLLWVSLGSNNMDQYKPPKMRPQPLRPSQFCKGCRKLIDNTVEIYSRTWWRQQHHQKVFRSLLRTQCNGLDDAIITRANSPVKSQISPGRLVSKKFYRLLPRSNPFFNKTWDTCAVVGNGGILFESHCGRKIDSADFVIRCNLPPLHGDFKADVGNKSSLVTANPSIFKDIVKQGNSTQRIAERIRAYGDAMIAFPDQTELVMRSIRIARQMKIPSRPVFLNPKYLSKLTAFWRPRGVKAARLSSGLFMVSMALELCRNVHVYGFWPFNVDPFGLYYLPHHYYDNRMPKRFHKMPAEFQNLLQLHVQGVIRLHLGSCQKPLK